MDDYLIKDGEKSELYYHNPFYQILRSLIKSEILYNKEEFIEEMQCGLKNKEKYVIYTGIMCSIVINDEIAHIGYKPFNEALGIKNFCKISTDILNDLINRELANV